jgi:hypothetical protein
MRQVGTRKNGRMMSIITNGDERRVFIIDSASIHGASRLQKLRIYFTELSFAAMIQRQAVLRSFDMNRVRLRQP